MKTTPTSHSLLWAGLLAAVMVAFVAVPQTHAQTGLKSNSGTNTKAKEAPEGSLSRLPAAVMRDERVSGAVNTVKSRVEEELDGRSTEDILRAAQQRIAASKGGTTITDVNRSGTTATATPTATARPVAAAPAPLPAASTPPAPAPAPAPAAASTPPVAPANPGSIPAPIPLRSKYEKEKKTSEQAMEIEADESVMDNNQRLVTFTGNVVVNHPQFKLTGDHLEVYLHEETTIEGGQATAPAGSGDQPPFKRAIATGSMVEIEKVGADGKTQIAKSRKADYDAKTGDIVLTGGPPTLQSGTGYVNSTSPDAVIILRGNGKYELPNESGKGGRHKLQIPIKGGAAAGGGGGIPAGNLDSITNRNKDR
jgi:lipopolysaccharide transport protein LptA